MVKINNNDFIEIDYTGKSDGKIFDTTNPNDAKELGIPEPEKVKPLIISVGNDMLLKGLDEDIKNKEVGKSYSLTLTPEKAFGKRNPKLLKIYSINNFRKQNINPYPGMALQLDNTVAKVLSVSGGRVIMDFNNPMAGKEVEYNYKILKKITDDKEKINALQDFFFKQRFDFELKDKKVIFNEQNLMPFLQMMAPKFKEITGLTFEIFTKKETSKKESVKKDDSKKEEKKETNTEKQQ